MGVTIDYANEVNVPNSLNGGGTRQLDTIYFTGAGYIDLPIKGISRDSMLAWEEPVWGGELTRSTNFVLTNIDTATYGLVARIELTFTYLNISDYKRLCNIAKERVCNVTYFNREKAQWVVNQEFAFTENSIKNLYAFGTKYIGVQTCSIKLVATNRDKADLIGSTFTITYNSNGGEGTIDSDTATWGYMVKLKANTFTKSGYTFKEWNTLANGTGERYQPNQYKTVWQDITLYAIWES